APPVLFCFAAPPPTALYTLSLHDALPICTTVTSDVIAVGPHTFEALTPILPYVDWFMPTAAEAMEISSRPTAEEAARFFLDRGRSEEHTSELQSREKLVCRLLLEKKKNKA